MASALLASGMHPQITWLLATSGDYLWKEELLNECPRGRHEEAFWEEPSRIGFIYIPGCGHSEQGLPHQLLLRFIPTLQTLKKRNLFAHFHVT